MKKITMSEIKKMWEESLDRFYVVYDYCKEQGLDYKILSEEDELDIYEELYPVSAFLKDYYEDIFYGDSCEPDEEVRDAYERAKG